MEILFIGKERYFLTLIQLKLILVPIFTHIFARDKKD